MTRGEGRRQEDTGTLGSSGPDLTTSGPCSPERGWGAAGAFHGGGGSARAPGQPSWVLQRRFSLRERVTNMPSSR